MRPSASLLPFNWTLDSAMQALLMTVKGLLSPAGGGAMAMQQALIQGICAALHIHLAAQLWPHSASSPEFQQLQHGAPTAVPSWQHTCDQLSQPRHLYSTLQPKQLYHSVLQPQPTGLQGICLQSLLQQQHHNLQGYRLMGSTSSSPQSADKAAAGRAFGATGTESTAAEAKDSAAEARDSAADPAGFSSQGTRETAAVDDALDPDEGEVLLDEWEEPDVRLDSSMLDAEWTSEGAVSTSHVEEFEDSADEYDVEFDEDFDFEDEEALQDNLPASADGREPGV